MFENIHNLWEGIQNLRFSTKYPKKIVKLEKFLDCSLFLNFAVGAI